MGPVSHRATAVVIAACATAAARAQDPWAFSGSPIDGVNSGDCKAIADIDLDGRGDAIVGGSSLAWYESGAGFARYEIRPQPVHKEFTTDCQAADVDSDGDPDIVIGDGGTSDNVLWFENPRLNPQGQGDPRDGAQWILHIIGTQGDTVHDIETADLDNDGTREIITSGHGFTRIWKRFGGTWSQRDLSSLAGDGVFIGDIDRDGKRDIATPRAWLRNPGDILGGQWMQYVISGTTSGDECLLADLNGDGRLDLVTCEAHNRGLMYWFEQPPVATSDSWTRRNLDLFMASHHPEPADFNRDGRIDILAGIELGEVAVYVNLGGSVPTFQKQTIAPSGGHNARSGDLNGDGNPDILACDYIGNPPISVHINRWCYPNCDASQASPILTVNDFVCYLNSFVTGSAYANCDGGGLNILDFQCYIARFVLGCP